MALTDDPKDPRLLHGPDNTPGPQNPVYLVLSDEEIAKGYTRPYRSAYRHAACSVNPSQVTTMGDRLSATYAREPSFYVSTYCTACQMHKPVAEFVWDSDGSVVGS